ncbi:arsenate reductase [Providencia stuartii]|uniref:arsenate reductase n=1 Tax=Providencia stuartii TaxID=588 RepID=UPI0011246555|nr:arsenate reductase [Providencia stuartii]
MKYKHNQLIDFILPYLGLINRLIVIMPIVIKFCQTAKIVLDILLHFQQRKFIKEDSELIITKSDIKVN